MSLLPGDEAPDFCLMSVNSNNDNKTEKVTLSSFKGRKVLLFFFPTSLDGVLSPTEFYQLDDLLRKSKNLNCEIIGISTDPLVSLQTFLRRRRSEAGLEDMKVILASDPLGLVGKIYKIYKDGEHKNFKAVVLVDEERKIMLFEKSDFPVGLNFKPIVDKIEN